MVNQCSLAGIVSAFAGSGQPGCSDGVGSNASFNNPCGIAIDQQTGNVYVTDKSNHSIRKITSQGVYMKTCSLYFFSTLMTTTGEVSTLAGSESGFADGNGEAAEFRDPIGICFDQNSQSLLVCDFNNEKLRRVQLNGTSPSHSPTLILHSAFTSFSDHLMQEK